MSSEELRPPNGEVGKDIFTDTKRKISRKPSNKPKAKKKGKSKSPRSETDLAGGQRNGRLSKKKKNRSQPRVEGNINKDEILDTNGNTDELSINQEAPTKMKKKKMRSHEGTKIESGYHFNDYEEEHTLPYSSSSMGSSMVSSKNNECVKYKRQLPPQRTKDHHDNCFSGHDDDDYMSEMDDLTPVDGHGQDYEMSVDDEEEPRFKYSTVDLSDSGFRNTNCCLILAGVFFILVAIAGSIILTKMTNSSNRQLLSLVRLRGTNLSLPL